MKTTFINIISLLALAMLDLMVYGFIGVMMMNYDDNWDASKGEYGSFSSMMAFDKAVIIAFYLWNIINVVAVIYFIRKLYRVIKNRQQQVNK